MFKISKAFLMFKISSGISQTTNSTFAHITFINRLHEKDMCLRLPKEVRPKGLSLHCIEQLIICNQSYQDSHLSQHLKKLKQICPKFISLMPQSLVKCASSLAKQDIPFIESLSTILKEMEVIVINGLQVRVILCEQQTCIGTIAVDYSLQKECNKYTMYVNDKSTPSL